MKQNLYVIYDCVAQESGQVFEARNDGVALRAYGQAMTNCSNPPDHTLLLVGNIEHDTGVIDSFLPSPVSLNVNTPEVIDEQGI
nr:MAG: nonstructural protein [Microviridae sp.]